MALCFRISLYFMLCWLPFLLTAQSVISLQEGESQKITKQATYFRDETGKLDLAAVLQPAQQQLFQPVTKSIISGGGKEGFFWLKVNLQRNSPTKEWVLYLPHVNLKGAELYYQDSLHQWKKMAAGFKVPIQEKNYPHYYQVFPLANVLHTPAVTCYLRMHTANTGFSLHLATLHEFDKFIAQRNMFYGIYLGIMLFILFNNVLLIFSLRNKLYFYYVVIVFLYIASSLCLDENGYFCFLFPSLSIYNFKIAIFGTTVIQIAILYYCILFLDMETKHKKFARFIKWEMIALCAVLVVEFFAPEHIGNSLTQLCGLISLATSITAGVHSYRKGYALSSYYLAAYISFFFWVAIALLYLNFGLPNIFPIDYLAIAFLSEVVLLAYALSKRFEYEKLQLATAKQDAQQASIWQLQENERLIKEHNQSLELKVAKRTEELNKALEEGQQINEELNITVETTQRQKNDIVYKNEQIMASINYALRIQTALLPTKEKFASYFGNDNFFILFKPKDIVSGDFYWINDQAGRIIVAIADCTGHGVPGALMTMIGSQLLYEIVEQRNITTPNLLLNELNKAVRKSLRQAETDNRDGMDIVLLSIDPKQKIVEAAGAMNSFFYIAHDQTTLTECKPDKFAIGGYEQKHSKGFTNIRIDLTATTTFYLLSDGYADQFGGANNRKFMLKNLKQLLQDQHTQPLATQGKVLNQTIEEWRKEANENQVDDILVVGIKIVV